MINISNNQALLGFSHFAKIGPKKMKQLEKYFSEARFAFLASPERLERTGLKTKLINEFIDWRKGVHLEEIENSLKKENVFFITWHDQNYPSLLKEIYDPPFIIYYKGYIDIFTDKTSNYLAIVGSRKHSAYAEKILNIFIPILVNNNIKIVSGLALGVDSLAHRICLAHSGSTIAVLGSGLKRENVYPTLNYSLSQDIIKNQGLLISEFPPQTQPLKQNFPQRNRIISGLCQATLIIEAAEKSGALITAFHALDQNREIMTIPGNIFSNFSIGPNRLIKMGAKTITSPDEILDFFKIQNQKTSIIPSKTKSKIELNSQNEKIIYKILQEAANRSEKITSDEITRLSKLDTSVINSTLSILELRGIAKNDDLGYYIN